MRREWDYDLSELCGGSTDPDAGALANRIETVVRRYERAIEAIVEMSGDQPARTAWNMVHLARAALSAARGTDSPQAEAVKE